jgi:hypothetical protein
MNSKFLKALPAIVLALVATAPLSQAVTYSPAQFNTELKKKVGTKTGPAAYNAAASFYKTALSDKNNKKHIAAYASFVSKLLKSSKVVAIPQQGTAIATVIKQMQLGYFKAPQKFNINDPGYNKALQTLLKGLPASQKNSTLVSQKLYDTIYNYVKGKGVSQDAAYQFYLTLAKKTQVVDPIHS